MFQIIIYIIILIGVKSAESANTGLLCNETRPGEYILRPIDGNLTIDCIAQCKAHMNATWYRGLGNISYPDKSKPVPYLEKEVGVLFLASIRISDAGFYSCHLTNGLTFSIYLDVLFTKPMTMNDKETTNSLAKIGQVARWSRIITAYPAPALFNGSVNRPRGVNDSDINITLTEISLSFYYNISVSASVRNKEIYGNYCMTIYNKKGKLEICHILSEGSPPLVHKNTTSRATTLQDEVNVTKVTFMQHPDTSHSFNSLIGLVIVLFTFCLIIGLIYFLCLKCDVTRHRRESPSRISTLTNSSSNYDRIDWNLIHYQFLDLRTRCQQNNYDALNKRPRSLAYSIRTSASSGNTFASPYEIQRLRRSLSYSSLSESFNITSITTHRNITTNSANVAFSP